MLSNPTVGQAVECRYRPASRPFAPLHGKTGIVAIRCRARRCRNHGVVVDGRLYVVPAGQLRKAMEG